MNDEQKKDVRDEPTPWYGLPFVALGHLFWIWLGLIAFEWIGFDVGVHAKRVFITELTLLQADHSQLYGRLMHWLAMGIKALTPLLTLSFDGAFAFLQVYWQGAVYVSLALFLRVLLLGFCWPLFLLAVFLGAFDGLVSRQRRTAFMGRETETLHYYSRKWLPMVVIATSYLWLFIPGVWAVSPMWMLLPGAALTGVLVRSSVASYKKYL